MFYMLVYTNMNSCEFHEFLNEYLYEFYMNVDMILKQQVIYAFIYEFLNKMDFKT